MAHMMTRMTRITRWLDSHDSLARRLAVCQDPIGNISVNCRWYISQLSVVYRSTVGGISVNCRSNISRVLIYQVSPMAFF